MLRKLFFILLISSLILAYGCGKKEAPKITTEPLDSEKSLDVQEEETPIQNETISALLESTEGEDTDFGDVT